MTSDGGRPVPRRPVHFGPDDLEAHGGTLPGPAEITLEDGVRALVNIGSIGQPRDDNPRASFAIYDTEQRKIRIHRVEYDVETASDKIRKAGLPEPLAERLKYGR